MTTESLPPGTTGDDRDPVTRTLALPDVDLVYDIRGTIPPPDGHPVLLLIAQPMCADGFAALADRLPDRTIVTYDPRGLGRSTTRRDGRTDLTPVDQAEDLHALVARLGAGPVDVLGSSGGAVTGLTWAAAYPDDIHTLVAHEPPSVWALPDAAAASRAFDEVGDAYRRRGFGAGMAAFLGLTMWEGEFTDDYFDRPAPDPTVFGLPADDDGARDDPLLSDRSASVPRHEFDVEALRDGPARIVVAVGEETGRTCTARTADAIADLLGTDAVAFPGGHGGFGAEDGPHPGRASAFATRLAAILDAPDGASRRA